MKFASVHLSKLQKLSTLALCLSLSLPLRAQEMTTNTEPLPIVNNAGSPIMPGSVATETWVTTQDFVAMRRGPSRSFEQITSVPAALTLPAYGRTSDTSWIQVEYEGQRGWITARYLVWTGDVINLPVDGVNPEPFIRRAASLGTLTRDAQAYLNWSDPTDSSIIIPVGATVELTGRIGEDEGNYYRNFFRVQIRYQNTLYWVASYDLRLVDGDYHRLLDLAYLFPYGRLYLTLQDNLALAVGSYNQSNSIWDRLAQGFSISCDPIPPLIEKQITTTDATRQETFIPAVAALEMAIDEINSTITAFRDACNNPSFTLTTDYIATQNHALDQAYRDLLLAASLLEPLRVRNPLLHGGEEIP